MIFMKSVADGRRNDVVALPNGPHILFSTSD